MWRSESKIGYKLIPNLNITDVTNNLVGWLEAQPRLGATGWLLAHAEEGVIWGKLVDGKLKLASHVNQSAPQLRSATLIEARFFGERAEIHLSRTNDGWQACRIEDQHGAGDSFDELHRLWGVRIDTNMARRLWGDQSNGRQAGFTLLHEPGVGITHTVPLDIPESAFAALRSGYDTYRPLVLTCRHYLGYDQDTGEAQIAATRLVGLHVEPYSEFSKRRQS